MKFKIYFALIITQFFTIFQSNSQRITFNPEEKYPKDSLQKWTNELFSGVSKSHPGFYRYTSKTELAVLIDSTINTISEPLNTIDYYRKLKPLYAKIGCLHTGINLNEEYEKYVEETYKLIPIGVYIDENKKVFISHNYATNSDLKIKSEIISINDKLIAEILKTILNSIPSDGYNKTLKIRLLHYKFSVWYQTAVELNTTFKIQVKFNNQLETHFLEGVKKDVLPTYEEIQETNTEQLDFITFQDKAAFLRIKSFAKSTIKKNGQNYKKYIKKVFKELAEKNIDKLIIDVRNNGGGTDGNAALLTRYFFDKPFRYWDKIEITEATAIQIKGLNRLFYKKPIKLDSTYQWLKAKQTSEFDYYETQKPMKTNFKGDVFILTNGLCMSSCADFVAILSDNNIAKVIGQETGGGYQGNTSGMMPETFIQANLMITTPIQKYTNYVDLKKNFGRGTIPDYKVYPTLEEWISKKDVEMEFLMKLLKE